MNDTTQNQDGWFHVVSAVLHRLGHGVAITWETIVGWSWTPFVVVGALVVGTIVWLSHEHRRWKRGWLSGLIDQRLSAIRKQRGAPKQRTMPRERKLLATALRLIILETYDRVLDYFQIKVGSELKQPYFPSWSSFTVLFVIIAAFFVLPRRPQLTSVSHWHWRDW
jgi:hypothetical protein